MLAKISGGGQIKVKRYEYETLPPTTPFGQIGNEVLIISRNRVLLRFTPLLLFRLIQTAPDHAYQSPPSSINASKLTIRRQ